MISFAILSVHLVTSRRKIVIRCWYVFNSSLISADLVLIKKKREGGDGGAKMRVGREKESKPGSRFRPFHRQQQLARTRQMLLCCLCTYFYAYFLFRVTDNGFLFVMMTESFSFKSQMY